jgi:hypothetical protein
MKFTAEQIDELEGLLSRMVSASRLFADQKASTKLSDLTGLMAEVRHFAHCIQYGGSTTEAQARWLDLFTDAEE